jgi:hypothetical protein
VQLIAMYEKEIEDDLDYELMHKQMSAVKSTLKEQLNSVIISSNILEVSINNTADVVIKKVESSALRTWAKNPFIPISTKLIALRFANIISEDLFNNIRILFKIRNQFAHKLIMSHEECQTIFAFLEKTKMKNAFLTKLPNDVIKFQLVASCCSVTLMKIFEILDPESVVHLEATAETTFEPIE